MLGKIEGRRRRGQQKMDDWMASSTQWTWVWASSRRWWKTGKPGVLQSMGLQRVRHDWATEQKEVRDRSLPHSLPLRDILLHLQRWVVPTKSRNPMGCKAKNIDRLALHSLSLLVLGLQSVQFGIVLLSSHFVFPREATAVWRAEWSLIFCKSGRA